MLHSGSFKQTLDEDGKKWVRGSFAAEPFTAGTFPHRGRFVAKCLCQHKKACSPPGPFRRHKATFRAENELSKSGVRFALAALV